MKYIREGRFGPPKCWKTGSVCDTYPKPMLVFEYEAEGLSIVKGYPESCEEVSVAQLSSLKPENKLYFLNLVFNPSGAMETTYVPAKDKTTFDTTVSAINELTKLKPLPFKTIVVDTVTGLSDSIWSHQAVTNSAALADPRKWAGNIGMKTSQVIDFLTMPSILAHVVFIFHTEISKDELTQKTSEQPMVYSKLRDSIGRKFSQFFYQGMVGGVPKIRVKSFDLVQGIGSRWPTFTTEFVEPTFDGIYGKEKDVLR